MKSKRTILAVLLLSTLFCGTFIPSLQAVAQTASSTAQAKEDWYKNLVDFDYMKSQVEIPPKPGVTLIDSRPTARKYDIGHIPGAINIPDTHFDKLTDKLPAEKNALLIFYCEGPECMLSHKSAFKAEKLGYSNIKVYPNGFPEWASKGLHVAVSAAYIKKQIDEKTNAVLIDARPARVFAKGSIPGAINIPDTQFDKEAGKLPADKTTPLIFFCGGLQCVLSDKSADKAKALGYSNVKTYPQGYPEWEKLHGTPAAVASSAASAVPAAAPSAVLEPGKEKGSVTIASFEKVMKENPDSILVVDVRDEKEFKKGAIKGSVNIPIDKLEKKLDTLPTGKPFVFVCGTGGRSGEAYDMVKLVGGNLQPWFIDSEMTFNADGSFVIKPAKK
ncbi:MAG: rhodanese-like protein [bacterium]|nr:MAG: rhodanese-like protein [bacterium]KAF0149664.1 MAG: rhodanese-like protein [bacterium]KAF0169330.1 MAG: rhodanese-like protein [bacterium]TXT21396.1 MAG: rhodanese-like protein [bacterium]